MLLLNLGGPDTLDDVQPFLYNLFADPDIIRLPPAVQFLQPAIASAISTLRAPKSREGYEAIGGGSPLRRITEEQATALREALQRKGVDARTYVAMRYWFPFTGLPPARSPCLLPAGVGVGTHCLSRATLGFNGSWRQDSQQAQPCTSLGSGAAIPHRPTAGAAPGGLHSRRTGTAPRLAARAF